MKWVTLAAAQGFAEAQFGLAVRHLLGQRVPQDYARAHMWWNLFASTGDEYAEKMTPSQIEKAQDLARGCLAKSYKDC